MEMSPVPAPVAERTPSSGFLSGLGWFFSGAVLPMGSLSFYRAASKRPVGLAILFFFVFTIFITFLTTINAGVAMTGAVGQIRQAYQQGKIPDIAIRNGIAQVDGPQPFIFLNERTSSGALFIAADTTGQLSSIDESRYTQGVLLTRTELHVLNPSQGYQRLPLSEINALFETDPIVINEQSVSNAWVAFSAISTVLIFIGLVLWNSVVRLMIIVMLALIFWGIGSLFRPKVGFGPFIITGLYAIVPAVYISHLFARSQASFFGLQTILLILFWAVALVGALAEGKFFSVAGTPHLWTALLGVPMLLLFIVDMFAKLPSPAGEIVLWVVALLTMLGLIALRLYFHLTAMQASAPPPAPPVPPQSPAPPPAAS